VQPITARVAGNPRPSDNPRIRPRLGLSKNSKVINYLIIEKRERVYS